MADRDSTLHVRLPSKLRRRLERAAEREGRTLSAFCVRVLAGEVPPPGGSNAKPVTR